MMSPRASLLAVLLACTPAAWADTINVTTVVDEDNGPGGQTGPNGPDTGCSLREAVKYMQLSTTDRKNGWGGCKTSDTTTTTDTINIPQAKTLDSKKTAYLLTLGDITVTTSVTISGTQSLVANYPVIQQTDSSKRVFTITRAPTTSTAIAAQISQLKLQGAGCTIDATHTVNDCYSKSRVDRGGIIFVSDGLSLSSVFLSNGFASVSGGAIFVNPSAALVVNVGQFNDNYAPKGAAIDVGAGVQSGVSVTGALFTANHATDDLAAIIELESAVLNSSAITSSTLGENFGVAVRARAGLSFHNVTIVNNSVGGVDFSGVNTIPVYNSIIAGNPNDNDPNKSAADNAAAGASPHGVLNDCINAGSNSVAVYNLFSTGACKTAFTATVNGGPANHFINNTGVGTLPSNQMLISHATTTTTNGTSVTVCDAPGSANPSTPPLQGLLCPLLDNGGSSFTYRPRLPVRNPQAATVSDLDPTQPVPTGVSIALAGDFEWNLIVNQGSQLSDGTTCATQDQRVKSLRTNSCDIGALAVQAVASLRLPVTTQISTPVDIDFVPSMGDVDLLPGFACSQVQSTSTVDGCIQLSNLVLTTQKGTATFNPQTHKFHYVPGSGFYGTDEFTFLVATTLSRYSDNGSNPQAGQMIPVTIVVQTQPASGISSKSLSAGAMAPLQLLALGSLVFVLSHRRRLAWKSK